MADGWGSKKGPGVKESWDESDDEEISNLQVKESWEDEEDPAHVTGPQHPAVPEETDKWTKKAQLQKMVQDSDLSNAADLFNVTENKPARHSAAVSAALAEVSLQPVVGGGTSENVAEFDGVRRLLVQQLKPCSSSASYPLFLQDLFRDLCFDLKYDDVKQLAYIVTVLSNERLKHEKESAKGKKKTTAKRATLKVGPQSVMEEDFADYDDYMD